MDAQRDNRVDAILHELSILHANMGSDSTKEEIESLKAKENYWKNKISQIDEELAKRLFP
jgi:hypothetical protein